MLKLIKIYFTILSSISPKLAAQFAFNIFQKVRKKDIRDREKGFFIDAEKRNLNFKKEDLDVFEFGTDSKDLVILIHGWDSNAGCMYGFVDELIKKNKRIISINLPAHATYKADKTNFNECKDAFKTLLANLPKHSNLSIIAHSFGSGISTYALSELKVKIDKLIFLTSPNIIEDIFIDFKKLIGLNKKSYIILKKKADKILGESLDDLIMEEKLKKINFNHLHLIHDINDKIIPYSNTVSMNKAIKNSSITSFENIGHYRMLWNPEVISKSISYLNH
jgi:pimeloyl-ACP methyl ester carboxylesterase